MKKIFIVAAKRTAIGKFLGSLSSLQAQEIALLVIKNILEEMKGASPSVINSVIVGNVLSAGLGQGVGRQASVNAGIPVEVPVYGINMVCGSGLKAVMNGCLEINAGASSIVLAGGTESMSNAGYIVPAKIRSGVKMGNLTMIDHMIHDGLSDAFNGYHMGITAENIAEKYGITREEQDAFSYESTQKAIRAIDNGAFKNEIVPVTISDRKSSFVFDTDEFPNRNSSLEKLASLRPAFKKDGTVTAGNSSGINDGSSFVLLADEESVKKYNLEPLAEVVSFGQGGVAPEVMGLGPVPAIQESLKRGDMTLSDIDIIELNEAFAAQSIGVIKELKKLYNVDDEWFATHCNPNGGAIALGHPIGASGNRILVTLVHELIARNKKFGLASLCIGGGMGVSVIIKNLQ